MDAHAGAKRSAASDSTAVCVIDRIASTPGLLEALAEERPPHRGRGDDLPCCGRAPRAGAGLPELADRAARMDVRARLDPGAVFDSAFTKRVGLSSDRFAS